MFRNNFNSSLPEINSSTPIGTLNYIKGILTQQRENYINLLNENRRMIDSINTYIDEYEIQTTTINPQQSVRSQLFSTNNRILSNDEILRRRLNTNSQIFQTPRINRNNLSNSINDYFSNEFVELFTTILLTELTTSSNLLTEEEIQNTIETICYGDIENPISERCPISYIDFENDTNVSRIKNCYHIFDPNSLTEWLTRQNTCPVCRYNLKSTTTTNDNLNSNVAGSYDVSGNRMYSRNGYTTHYYFTR